MTNRYLEVVKEKAEFEFSNFKNELFEFHKEGEYQSKFVEELFLKEYPEIEIEINGFDNYVLCMFKFLGSCNDFKTAFKCLEFYEKISKKNNFYDFDTYYSLYEMAVLIKKEETEIVGNKSEKFLFKNADSFIEEKMNNFKFVKFQYHINGKFIDMLGICKETGKYIIVEFKKGRRCAANQLYAYDRLMGGNNILVSLTEREVYKKQDGIIYFSKEVI